jgi:phage shock protein A
MGVMKRVSGIFQAKANKLLDKAEDPRETLDLSYEKQLEMLQKVRRSVADVATARKRIEIQADQLKQQAAKLETQARQALQQNREDLAREALSRREAIASQLQDLETQHQQVAAQEQKLIATAQRLQTQVETFRTQKETVKASYTAAQAQTKVDESIAGISEEMGDAGLAMQRAQDKIQSMQARAGAMDELLQSGALSDLSHPGDDIQRQLEATASASNVDLELARLKGELGGGAAGALGAGSAPGGAQASASGAAGATTAGTASATPGAADLASGPVSAGTVAGAGASAQTPAGPTSGALQEPAPDPGGGESNAGNGGPTAADIDAELAAEEAEIAEVVPPTQASTGATPQEPGPDTTSGAPTQGGAA